MRPLYIFIFSILCITDIFAQLPPACAINNPPLAKQCSQACILCELDGYASATTQTIQGQIIPDYCTQVVHSMGYVGFVAGSANLSIQVDIGACTQGNSIEMGIFQTDDCQEFTLVGDCNTAMFTGNSYVLSNTAPLVPGCPYFLVTDNNGPAACAFTVTVIGGSGTAPTVSAPAIPSGPTSICPGSTVEYSIPPIFGACKYRWTAPAGALINGAPSPAILDHSEGTTVTVTWGNTGGQLCVSGSNPCSQGPQSCLPVTISVIPPTILPTTTICNGASYEWIDGNLYAFTQLLSTTYVTPLGCDSTVREQLIVAPPIIANLGVIRVCEGECASVGNGMYCDSGSYIETVTATNGCDSTIYFNILAIEANAVIAPADTLSCTQDTLVLDGSGSTGGSFFIWQDSAGTVLSNTNTLQVNEAGPYRLIIQRTVGNLICRDTALTTVFSNQQLPDLVASGDTLTCGQPTGQVTAESNTADVIYSWTGPGGFQSSDPAPGVTIPGVYNIELTAPNGCSRYDSVVVISDQNIPVLTTSVSDTLSCQLDSVLLSALTNLAGTTFTWSGPQNFSANQADTAVVLPGQYTLVALAPNGCSASDTVQVLIDTIPPQLTVASDTLTCQQQTSQLTAVFTPANAAVSWMGPQNFSASIPDPLVTEPGVYTAIVTAGNGCTVAANIQVVADTISPTITIDGGTLSCSQQTVTLSASVQPSGSTLAWAGPQNFSSNQLNPMVNVPGTYTLTAMAPNGCTAIQNAIISADTLLPQLSVSGDTLTCTQNSVTLSLSVFPAGSSVLWSGPANFSSTQINPVITEPGDYVVVATAPNGCTASTQVSVVADASIPQVSAVGGTITCTQPSLNLSAVVSPAGSTISWSGPQNFSSGLLNPSVTLAGQYVLLATTSNGCTAIATVDVLVDTLTPLLMLTGGIVSCAQPTVDLSAIFQPDTALIIWTGPQNFSSSSTDPTTAFPGNYTAVVTAANGCSVSGMVSVQADTSTPVLTTMGGTLSCLEPVVSLSVSALPANSTLQWSGPQNFSSNLPDPISNLAGLYTVVATAANGCSATANAVIQTDTIPPQLSATGGIITCAQAMATIEATVFPANAQLLWSGPLNFTATVPTPIVSLDGNYTVQATAANGCTAVAMAQVQVDTVAPQVSASGGLLTCVQNTLPLNATVNPANSSIQWSGPQAFSSTLLNPVINIAGTYILTATAANGCTAVATAEVLADSDFPTISVSGGTLDCTQTAVNLDASVTPAGTALSWAGPQNFSSTIPDPSVSLPGNYTLTATTSAGCTATAVAVVQIDTVAPQVTTTVGIISCDQPSATISAMVAPQNSTVLWQGPQNFSSTQLTTVVTNSGQYLITVSAPNGCTAQGSNVVNADTLAPQVQVSGGTLSCTQLQVQLSLIVQPANSTVSWVGPQNFSSNQLQPTVLVAGTYTVLAIAANGCSTSAMTLVNADVDLPQVQVMGGTITCTQPNVSLTTVITPGGGSLAWTGPQNFSSNLPNPVVSQMGTYTLTVSLPNGCSSSASANVLADLDPPILDAFGNDITCREDSTVHEAIVEPAGSSLLWSGPQNFSSTQAVAVGTQAGVYTVIATAPNGCTESAQVTVTGLNQPTWTLSLGADLEAEEFEPLFPHPVTDLPMVDWAEVVWEFPAHVLGMPCTDCQLPVIKLARSGEVTVYLTDPNGCTQSATYQIRIQQTSAIYVPNIFYPEGTSDNQVFGFHIGAEARVVEVRDFHIFDRWGNMVHYRPSFLPGDPSHVWDGFFKGKKAQPGVYVWYATVAFANGRIKLLKGDVTLYR